MSKTHTPKAGESVRHIEQTTEDRAKYQKEFKEGKAREDKIKEERFAAIQERRKKPSGGSGGRGIDVKVGKDV